MDLTLVYKKKTIIFAQEQMKKCFKHEDFTYIGTFYEKHWAD